MTPLQTDSFLEGKKAAWCVAFAAEFTRQQRLLRISFSPRFFFFFFLFSVSPHATTLKITRFVREPGAIAVTSSVVRWNRPSQTSAATSEVLREPKHVMLSTENIMLIRQSLIRDCCFGFFLFRWGCQQRRPSISVAQDMLNDKWMWSLVPPTATKCVLDASRVCSHLYSQLSACDRITEEVRWTLVPNVKSL